MALLAVEDNVDRGADLGKFQLWFLLLCVQVTPGIREYRHDRSAQDGQTGKIESLPLLELCRIVLCPKMGAQVTQ